MENTLLCCDWGTSAFRLRWVDMSSQQVLGEAQSGEGIAATFNGWKAGSADRLWVYQQVLAKHIVRIADGSGYSLERVPVVISGMASSSIGMAELPYADLPFLVDGSGASVRRLPSTADFPHEVLLISGVRSERDVMRGEETQLIGLHTLWLQETSLPDKATLIFPGTHSKHIQVQAGVLTNFRTYMTGELFALLAQHSILNDSVSQSEEGRTDENLTWFRQGVREAASASLLNALFSVRVNQLFSRVDKVQNYWYLSGLLIGSELQDLARQPQALILCSGSNVFPFYEQAMQELGLMFSGIPVEVMEKAAVAGQVAIVKKIYQGTKATEL